MKTTLIAGMFFVIIIVGAYIGISGLAQQYAIGPGSSQAGSVICAPQSTPATIGQSVHWNVSGISTGTRYHWVSDEGRSEVTPTGQFSVIYAKPGIKTVHLFSELKNRWYETICTVQVR